jgi:hypothetical protein
MCKATGLRWLVSFLLVEMHNGNEGRRRRENYVQALSSIVNTAKMSVTKLDWTGMDWAV